MEYTLPYGSLLISDNAWLHENVVVVEIHYMEHVCTYIVNEASHDNKSKNENHVKKVRTTEVVVSYHN